MSKKIWIMLIYTILALATGIQSSNNQCGEKNPVAHICNASRVVMASKAFIEFSNSPDRIDTPCTCVVSPSSPNIKVHLRYREITKSTNNISFIINGEFINKNRTSTTIVLSETKGLTLETDSLGDKEEGVCLLLQTIADSESLNISCKDSTSGVTESSATEVLDLSTLAVPDSTEMNTRPTTIASKPPFDSDGKSRPDTDGTSDSSITGVIIGSAVGGGVVIAVVIFAVLIYRRRTATKGKKNNTEANSKQEDVVATQNKGDESDYYMTENAMYNMTEPIEINTEIPYYTRVNKNTQFVERIDDNDNNHTTDIYHVIPDSPNDVSQPLMSETTRDKNINDSRKCEDTTDCEYTEIENIEEVDVSLPRI